MYLTVDRKTLHAGLSAVVRAIHDRSSLPVLLNVLLEAKSDGDCHMLLRATDLELSIERRVPISCRQPGSVTLPARTLVDIVAALPDGEVTVSTEENHAGAITRGKSRFRIQGLPAFEYPPAVGIGSGWRFRIGQDTLHRLISRVISAVSRDDTRPVLTGAEFQADGNALCLAATDTHRLNVAQGAIVTDSPFDPAAPIVPGRALRHLLHLLDDRSGDAVICEFDANQARFAMGHTVLTK